MFLLCGPNPLTTLQLCFRYDIRCCQNTLDFTFKFESFLKKNETCQQGYFKYLEMGSVEQSITWIVLQGFLEKQFHYDHTEELLDYFSLLTAFNMVS